MNTLNNQQINPGNRVDFSRIRRFSKGGIPKYQGSGKISNTFNTASDFWTNMNNDIISNWANIANNQNFNINDLNQFLTTNRSLYNNSGYDGTKAIKYDGVQQYQQDFHNKYGFGNTESFWGGMKTVDKTLGTGDVRPQEGQQFVGDNYFGTQTDYRRANYFSNDELARANEAVKARGWEFVVDDAQNEGHTIGDDGRQFYKLQEIQPTSDQPAKTTSTNYTTSNTDTQTTGNTNSQRFTPIEFLPQYQKGKWTGWEHLPGMAARNLMTNARNLKLDLQKQVPLAQASQQNEVVTNDYVGRTIMQQQLAEARARNSAAASNTSNADAARAMQLDFESQVAMPAEMQMAQRQSDEFNRTTELAQQKADANTTERTRIANYNREQLAADFNSKINAKQKYNLNKTQEFNSLSQNLAASKRQYDLQEAYNKDLYNQNVNNFLTLQQQQKAYDQYQTALKDGWKTGTGYEDLYNYLIGGGDDNFTQNQEYVDTLTQNKYDLTKVRPILETLAKDNPQIQAWLDNYDSYAGSQKLAYEKAYRQAALRNSRTNLFQKQYYTGPNDPALNRNLSTMYPGLGGYYKKGGKVEDRIIKYIEHNRKALKDQSDRVSKAQSEQSKKLARDLDALDRETLMLLRAIFK